MKYVVVIWLVLVGCTQTPTAPTVSFSANPASVKQGQCATLTWSSTNASKVSIDQGLGNVDPSGSKQVCPGRTTHYTITAAGEGGSGTASTMVSVTALATKVMIFPEAALFEFGKSESEAGGEGEDSRVPRTGERRVGPCRQGDHHWLHRQRRYARLQLDAVAAACGSGPRCSDQSRGRSPKVAGQRCGRGQADRR